MKGKVARPEVLVVSRVDETTVRFSQVVQIFCFHCWGVEMFNSLLNTYQGVDFVQQRRSIQKRRKLDIGPVRSIPMKRKIRRHIKRMGR